MPVKFALMNWKFSGVAFYTVEKRQWCEQQVEGDSTDRVFNFLENLMDRLQEDFDEIIGEDNDKKRFIKSGTRIFALLLNTKVDTVNKIKRILKIAIKTMLKILSWQKWLQNVGLEEVEYLSG